MKVGDLVRTSDPYSRIDKEWLGVVVRVRNGYVMIYSMETEVSGWYHPTNFEVINESR